MHSKKAAFACGLSLAAVAILVPLVSRVNHYGSNSQPGAGARELRGDVNPVPPLPPPKGKPGAAETLNADVNPVPPPSSAQESLDRVQHLHCGRQSRPSIAS